MKKSTDTDFKEKKSKKTGSTLTEEVYASEVRYRRLFESAKDGVLILDAETGKIVDVNPFLIDLLNYSKEEFIEKSIWEIGAFKDICENKVKFLELQQKEYVRYDDLPIETSDGREILVEFVSNVYLVKNKKVIQCQIRDVTARKKAEVALEKTRKELAKIKETTDELNKFTENIIDTVREPLLAIDKDLRVIKASSSFYKCFKVTAEETIGKLIYELGNHQWDIPKLKELLEEIIPEKNSFDNYEVEHNFSTIGKRVMLLNARQVKRAFGKEKIILLAFEDITERKGKEDILKETHRATSDFLNILLNHMHAPIIIWDTSMIIKRFNSKFEQLSGYDSAEVIDKRIDFLFPKEKIAETLELLKNHLDDEHEATEIDILTKDKNIKTVLWNSSHILDEEGENIIATISQDITRRKLTEDALNFSETRYRRLFESAKDGILILDAKTGKIADVNPFLIDLLGYSKKEFIEKSIWEIGAFMDIYENKEKFFELQQEKYVRYDDLPLVTSDGRKIQVEFVSNVYLANNCKVIQCNIRDITERTNIQKELKFQANLINNIGKAVIATDLLGKVTYWNNAAEKIYGWSASEAIGKNIMDLTPARQSNEQAIDIMKKLSAGETWAGEFNVKRKDGNSFPAFVTDTPILDSNGELTGIIGISSDITERKRIRQKIEDSEKRFKAIFDQAPFAIALIDTQGHILISNLKLAEMIGYSSDEISKLKFTDFTHPEDIDKDMKSFTDLTNRKIKAYTLEKRYIHKNGAIVWVNLSVSLLSDLSGTRIEILGIAEDITERKNSEKNLKESEEKFRTITENSADAIFITDKKGKYIYVNKQAVELLGYSKEELFRFTLADISPKNRIEEYFENFQQLFITGSSYSEIELVKKDGSYADTDLNAVLLPNGWIYGSCRDISERKKLENELITAKEKAEESDRLKSAFLANMSHEIRTPMNGILGFADLLKNPNLTGEKQQSYIQIIGKSGARMLNIINDIVSISKIESGLMEMNMSLSNMNEQIEYIYTFFKPEIESKGMQFLVKNALPFNKAIVKTDREKLFAILSNLVKNAVKFSEKGTIEMGYVKKEGFLEFYVKDSGIGIDKDRQKAIFERFIQADISDKDAYQGAGLGLSISKSYVEMLGGKLWVESKKGEGSIFYFTIPYQTELQKKAEIADDTAKGLMEDHVKNLKILIVEDDETSDLFISIILEEISNNILHAKSGLEAIEFCHNNPDIDLILMDIKMPEMGGHEATRKIRQFNKDVIVIAQTAHGLLGDREKAIEAGCNDYISKPILKNELQSLIKQYFKNYS